MRLLITYQYFLPAYKAGGPIQSINNLAKSLSVNGAEVFVLCSNQDLGGSVLDVKTDVWQEYTKGIKVYYSSQSLNRKKTDEIIDNVNPDCIFINGLYSLTYTVYPLLYAGKSRRVLSVRGMLHPGALSQKKLKKDIFLSGFKMLGLHNKCEYHATTEQESVYIKNTFGKSKSVWTVSNLPNVFNYHEPVSKESGNVKLVSISLISPMKNILLIIKALKEVKHTMSYDIYGPVKDSAYWDECLTEMKSLPANIKVSYKGEVVPVDIEKTLIDYHYFILPSKSENFGHAIYEAMSAGRPVVTSHNTPWNNLSAHGAGHNIDPENKKEFVNVINKLCEQDSKEYIETTLNAKSYITEQYDIKSIEKQYIKMFS